MNDNAKSNSTSRRRRHASSSAAAAQGTSAPANTAPIPPSEVHRRASAPPQHVDGNVHASAGPRAGTQSVPPLAIDASVEAHRLPAPVMVSPTNPRGRPRGRRGKRSADGKPPRLWRRLLHFIFQPEEFDDFDCAVASVSDISGITVAEQRAAYWMERMYLPGWLKHVLFDIVDFWMRKRVHFVLLLLSVLLFLIVPEGLVDDMTGSFAVDEDTRPGLTFFKKYNHGSRELPRRHPVAIVPGFITGALEVWETGLPCVRNKTLLSGFRQRMFGSQMILLILSDPQCWLDLFSLNKDTGYDKVGTKVRADSGFASVDYFVPGYWVWAKILINLADIGYDPQSMGVMAYDWRLSPRKTHERDGFFFQLRNSLRFLCQKNQQRAVVISHSYGGTVALAFFRWAERREMGFMDRHVAYYVNLGGTSMGIGKAASALLFGDAKDTLAIPGPARKVLDTFVSQESRYRFTRSWSCFVSMLPMGCEEAWPNLIVLPNGTSLSTRGTAQLIAEECARSGHRECVREVGYLLDKINDLPSLPQAPRTTVACFYGVGMASETGYHLIENEDPTAEMHYVVNSSVFSNGTSYGVTFTDGDETVALMSLAYMCRAENGWRKNVGRVVTREYNHNLTNASPLNLRGGSQSGRHVDILGNFDMLEDLLKIVSGVDEQGEDPAMDEFTYTDDNTGGVTTLWRRVHDRIYSDVDNLIQRNLRECLQKPNKAIEAAPAKVVAADEQYG